MPEGNRSGSCLVPSAEITYPDAHLARVRRAELTKQTIMAGNFGPDDKRALDISHTHIITPPARHFCARAKTCRNVRDLARRVCGFLRLCGCRRGVRLRFAPQSPPTETRFLVGDRRRVR